LQYRAAQKSGQATTDFAQALDDGKLAMASIAARDLAEKLENAGREQEAETMWAASAQSALAFIAEQRGVDNSPDWLVASGDRFVMTPEARQLLKEFQLANGMTAAGTLGPQTFDRIQQIESSDMTAGE
jgi:murein L,D-transpeptidase YcbB/YkuD